MAKVANLEMLVEYLEGESEPRGRAKLEMLLRHSIHDRVVLDNLRRLRQMVKNLDPAQDIDRLLNNQVTLGRLTDRIMSGVASGVTVPFFDSSGSNSDSNADLGNLNESIKVE